MTVAVAIDQFFDSDEAPWNYMMATAIIYSLPPVAIYFGLRRFMVAGLTMGGRQGLGHASRKRPASERQGFRPSKAACGAGTPRSAFHATHGQTRRHVAAEAVVQR